MIRLVIVSDVRIYREGLSDIIDRHNEVSVVGTAHNDEHAVQVIHDCAPDVVLIDMTMIASREVISHITTSCLNTSMVALAITEDEESILACAKAGIAGYVSRDASITQLINTVCAAVEGELHCPSNIASILFNNIRYADETDSKKSENRPLYKDVSKLTLLTRREKQIALLLSDGFTNKQIAHKLIIEVSTVKNHVHNILTKIGVHSRFQAAQLFQHQFMSD